MSDATFAELQSEVARLTSKVDQLEKEAQVLRHGILTCAEMVTWSLQALSTNEQAKRKEAFDSIRKTLREIENTSDPERGLGKHE